MTVLYSRNDDFIIKRRCNQPAQKAQNIKCSANSSVNWKQSDYTSPKDRTYPTPDLKYMPWIELKPDREISTRMLGSLTKYDLICIQNDEFCIQNDEVLIQNDELTTKVLSDAIQKMAGR